MRRHFRTALLAAVTVLSACGYFDQTDCTLEARASVQVRVVDTRGNPRRDARVTFTRDGGPEQLALCNGVGPQQGDCDTWVTGYEQPGEYVITATSADGQHTARQSVSVGDGRCHVQAQSVTLTLPE
ncbi:hypothetical protein JQX13_14150 [Archangium violaceum]|uniref:hypothetical protein n=1 Tax=Archangium violaceum TaxID=83451 RepID=UPI00193C0060|nr:hypothetical protein [Archangium violaceum]QRK11106.1 hypothetical protein JQX13_14150 [Archangium violaceum]